MTVEIGNTDAEGRLVLADALALADEEKPDLLVDMGTLTGAARVALGPDLPPFYTNDETLALDVARCAKGENDPLWRMPLWPPYDSWLDSKVANINNAPSGTFAGSITCALFLQRFVEHAKSWLHVDIYGWTPPRNRRGRKAANARPRGQSTNCWVNAMDDPRLTPARGDLAAKYLEGKVKAERFVAGEIFEVSGAIAPLREAPSTDAALLTQALKGEHVTVYDRNGEGFAWGQLNSDRLCRLASGFRADEAGRRADPQGHRDQDVRLSRPLDQAAAGRDAPDGRDGDGVCEKTTPSPSPAKAGICRFSTSPASTSASRISLPSPNVLSARPICGAARAALASIARASCSYR